MSYTYYEDELNRLPPDDGYGISIQVRCGGEHTKWMTLTDECRSALLKFLLKTDTSNKTFRTKKVQNLIESWKRES